MKLYYYVAAPFSRKAMVAAYEKDVSLDWVTVRPFVPGAMDWMRAETKQPFAQIPLLQLDDGTFIRESSIICEYFDLLRPDKPLLIPEARREALPVRMLDRFTDGMLAASTYLSWAVRKSAAKRNQPKIDSSIKQFWTMVSMIEPTAAEHEYLLSDQFTLADISVSCAIAEMTQFWGKASDLEAYPNMRSWFARTQERPSWVRTQDEFRRIHDESLIPPQG